MAILNVGNPHIHAYHWATTDGVVSTGTGNVYFQTNNSSGQRVYLQSDLVTLGTTQQLFPLTYNATTKTWDYTLTTPLILLNHNFDAIGEHSDVDGNKQPRISLNYDVKRDPVAADIEFLTPTLPES